MSNAPDAPTSPLPLALTPGQQRASAAIAAIAALLALAYLLVPRWTTISAPQCAVGADCAVQVSAPVESLVLITLLVIVALFALMAVTGFVWAPKFGGGAGVDPAYPPAEQVAGPPEDAEVLTLEDVAPTATTPQAQTATVQVPANLQLWNTLPPQVQFTAAEYGTSLLGVPLTDLQLGITQVAHEPDRADSPYYATFDLGGTEKVLRLSAPPPPEVR